MIVAGAALAVLWLVVLVSLHRQHRSATKQAAEARETIERLARRREQIEDLGRRTDADARALGPLYSLNERYERMTLKNDEYRLQNAHLRKIAHWAGHLHGALARRDERAALEARARLGKLLGTQEWLEVEPTDVAATGQSSLQGEPE